MQTLRAGNITITFEGTPTRRELRSAVAELVNQYEPPNETGRVTRGSLGGPRLRSGRCSAGAVGGRSVTHEGAVLAAVTDSGNRCRT